MSALQRARSRSKTAPEVDEGIAQTNGAIPSDWANPSPTSPPAVTATTAPTPGLEGLDPKSPALSAAEMLTSLPASNILAAEPQAVGGVDITLVGGFEELPDNRSSSLSELGDASDERSEPTPRASAAADLLDNDSEAETERIENTPRKSTRTTTDTSIVMEAFYERTPSKLIQSTTVDDDSVSASPTTPSAQPVEVISGSAALDTLSFLAASEAASLEIAGKKRKRSSAESSSVDEPTDEPARKRSSTTKDTTVNGSEEAMVDRSEQIDVEEELDLAEGRISALAQEELELEERQADVAAETISELATVAKLTKPRKGGRRGKRKLDDSGGTGEIATNPEAQEGEGDGDNEDEDSAAVEEEVAKKKSAIGELAKIERKFKIFREKLCDEQIAQCEQELDMLKQPKCVHPEYLAMIQCIDERRAGKVALEKALLGYKQQTLETITVAERHQIHSQYFQTVRDLREDILSECNQRVYELQRGRRQLGVEDIDYSLRLPEKRSEQIRQQTAYNLEVSILSGVAKHVGFPAAPQIRPARQSEIEDDLRAMKITSRPPAQPMPYVRSYNRSTKADEAAAEEQFIERTPWANPQHPLHQQSHYAVAPGPSRAPSQSYQTPAGQRHIVDLHAPNGSASTIEVNSNPPSSTARLGAHSNGRITDSASPALQMKRNPSDHPPFGDTPGSGANPRTFPGIARDPYYSSPATEPQADEQGPRWADTSIRPLNAAVPPSVPASVGRQVPLTQRSNINPISVGSGNALFGR